MPTPSYPWVTETPRMTTIWAEGGTPPPGNCDNYYRSRRVDDYFYKECPTGEIGSGLYFVVPEGKFWSMVSQEDADEQAIAYLEEQGQTLANLNGECKLGDFTEVFTSMQTAVNWDWIADKNTGDFPFYGYGGAQANGYTLLPMMNLTFFKGTNGTGLPSPYEAPLVPFAIHPTHGLMHIDFANVLASRTDLIGAGWVTTGDMAQNLIPFQTYSGFLLADFGSDEIHGDAAHKLGGCLAIISTAQSYNSTFEADPTDAAKQGHFNGYIISYKDSIKVWRWSADLGDYEELADIPFNFYKRTAYVGFGIRYDRGQWAAEIYINGAWQHSIFDDNILMITVLRYQRDVLSMDYWFGDLIIGSMSPYTNRTPPALYVHNFAPVETYVDWPVPDNPGTPENENAGYDDLRKMGTLGSATSILDGVSGFPEMRALTQAKAVGIDVMFAGPLPNGSTPETHIGVRWDPTQWTEGNLGQQERLFGCAPGLVFRWSREFTATFLYGDNRIYQGPLYAWDENNFWQVADADYPDIIPDLDIFGDDPYADYAYLFPTETVCKPGGFDKPVIPIDMIEPYLWESMQHQAFPYTGTMYTKEYIASRWVHFKFMPQWVDNATEPDEVRFIFELPMVRMFSGVRGLRTREVLERPTYVTPGCKYPSCQPNPVYPNQGVLQSTTGQFTGDHSLYTLEVEQLCDTLFGGLYNVEQGGWDWSFVVRDIEAAAGERYLEVTVSMISMALMDSYLASSSQLEPLHGDAESVRILIWRTDWPLPVFDKVMTLSDMTLNVPPLPPSGGAGMPPEATFTWRTATADAPTGNGDPMLADLTGTFYVHIMGGY